MAWIPKRTCARCLLESPNTRSIESTGSCPGTYGAPRPTRSGRLLRGKTSRRLRRTLTEYLQAPRRAIDDYFRELEPLLKRSICAVDLEEQPLPPPLALPEMMESQPELMGALHPRYTPAGEGGREPKLRNVLFGRGDRI